MVSAALSGRPTADADAAVIAESLAEPDRFARIFDLHADEIHRYAARRLGADQVSLADDVTAETFLVAFRKRRSYDLTRPDARPWLYGIAGNLISKHRRTETRKLRALARTAEPDGEAFEQRSVDRMDAERLGPSLAAALAKLGAAERELLFLLTWAELSYEQASEALGIPVGTVRSRLSRTRAKIRSALEGTR
ncbi:RNA polymerase sigma factor [Nonomuraea endophytica]|uniref:RNA polymerase sigma-70 factor (ECF subfamily) n=1 Tax=Nonomuraea endophytica TaxID=714136 RepID=A0A7W8A679_9ACTN|nr:RNA polymerase sigma factor [Nonomuraea endophytica]MBB5080308.1 RNA polymerase sigma-70 factor (ECF subfamily) [Nonomuraea endophytica]